jgi:hypothetical protein
MLLPSSAARVALGAATLLSLAACRPQEPVPAASLDAAVLERFGTSDVEYVELALTDGLPESFDLPLAIDGLATSARLERHSLRAPGFRLEAWTPAGMVEVEAPAPATYRGRLRGLPGTMVLAALGPFGLSARLESDLGPDLRLVPARELQPTAPAALHLLLPADAPDLRLPACGAESLAPPTGGASVPPPGSGWTPPMDPDCHRVAEIAFDTDYEYYLAMGGTVAGAVARVESHLNEVDYFYARDARISYTLTHTIVRTAPFYNPSSGGNLLDLFRAEWLNNQGHITRDMAHLMTAKPGSIIQYGGLAWVGVVCTDLAFGWSMDSAGIVGHEVGHNWAAGHCHDTSPCNNMCGACLFIAPVTRSIIQAHRDSRWCLDAGSYDTPVPPYVLPDTVHTTSEELDRGPLLIDPTANDEDGNCEPVWIAAVDPLSAQGASLEVVPPARPGERPRIRYTPGAAPARGTDTFQYQAGGSDGMLATGTVTVEVATAGLAELWRFDEGSGATAASSAPGGHDGVIGGMTQWTTGRDGAALRFLSTADQVAVPPLGLNADRLTLAAWVFRRGPQNQDAGVVFARGGSTAAGIRITGGNRLAYSWNDDAGAQAWDSGLVVPDRQWVLVALVVQPDGARMMLHDGAALQTAGRLAPHAAEAFDADFVIGQDPGVPTLRSFQGSIDDVRVYRRALEPAEVEALGLLLGSAEFPDPPDDGALGAGLPLRWFPAYGATSHEVYLGSDYGAVGAATTASAEYLGSTAQAEYTLPPLAAGRWFWRVDEVANGVRTKGAVWRFDMAEGHHWRLDETGGATAADEFATHDGSYLGAPSLGEPGATPRTGSAVYFDGSDDEVEIPALNLNSNRFSASAWIRRDGDQPDYAGLVFSRKNSTIAGLHFGKNNGLRYHWNNWNWDWKSGLTVPDQQWVFVAWVVEPDRATIYLGDNGALQSSTHWVAHDPEEFDGVLTLGQDPASYLRYFRGWMDDVRTWNGALSEAQIRAVYDATR